MSNPQRRQRGDTHVSILFPGMFLVFLTLKLAGVAPVASWSWWWVTAPLWGGVVLALAIFVVVLLVALIAELCSSGHKPRVPSKYKLRGPFR